jgi:hypothetical protein
MVATRIFLTIFALAATQSTRMIYPLLLTSDVDQAIRLLLFAILVLLLLMLVILG